MKNIIISFFLFMGLLLTAVSAHSSDLKPVNYNGGFFTIKIPSGWKIYTAGQCSELAFVIRDQKNPLRQIFFFGAVGPVYMSQQQKQIDWNYMNMGGYPINWIEMPVVNPLTPENFMLNFQYIACTQIAQQFMPQVPRLKNFRVISVTQQPSMIYGGSNGIVRALFTKSQKAGEGLFMCTVAPGAPYTGGPGGGSAYGFMVAGITAPKKEFAKLQPFLAKSLGSFSISQTYVNQCIHSSQAAFQQVMKAGQTLRETSDMIMEGWESRNKTQDIMAEKQSDAMLGFERVYDPDTQETYQVDPQFWEQYKLKRERFETNNLQVIPSSNYGLWNKAPKPQREIR